MVRRFGTLGVGALLSLSLATGCVMTGNSEVPLRADNPIGQMTPRPAQRPPLEPPSVVGPRVDELATIQPPKPPPEPTIQLMKVAPPDPLPTSQIARVPAELNDPAILAAMRSALEKHPAEMYTALQKYDKHTQEVLLALLPFAVRVSECGLDKLSASERAVLLTQLDQVMATLRGPTPVSVEKICYCRHITNYGLYDPLPEEHAFAAGERNYGELVQLYVEARNFASKQNGKFYETALASKLEIYSKGELVVRMDFPARPDRSLSQRQDYFLHFQFYVPAKMEPGDYTLTISLQDENVASEEARCIAKRSLPFHVAPVTARDDR